MTGFILTFQDVSNDIDRYETIDQTLLSFKKSLDTHFSRKGPFISDLVQQINTVGDTHQLCQKKLSREFNKIIEKYFDMSRIILDSTVNKLPLTTLSLQQFLSSIKKRIKVENGIDLRVLNNDTDTQILADTYSFTVAFIFLIINLSELTSQKKFDLKVSKSNDDILFDIKWDKQSISQNQIKTMVTKKIRALPSFGYVLKLNRSEFKIISDPMQTCSQVRIKAKAQLKSSVIKKKQTRYHNR